MTNQDSIKYRSDNKSNVSLFTTTIITMSATATFFNYPLASKENLTVKNEVAPHVYDKRISNKNSNNNFFLENANSNSEKRSIYVNGVELVDKDTFDQFEKRIDGLFVSLSNDIKKVEKSIPDQIKKYMDDKKVKWYESGIKNIVMPIAVAIITALILNHL